MITDESEVSIEEQKSNSIHIVGAKYAVLTEGESCHYEVKIKDIYGDAELKEDKHIEGLYTYKIEETDDGCNLTLTGGKTSGKCNIWLETETGVKSETITLEVNKKEESKTEQSKLEVSKAEESKIEESKTEQSKIEESKIIKEYKTYDYKTLARNPNKYKGEYIKLYGKVIQVQESTGVFSDDINVELRVDMTATKNEYADNGLMWDDTVYVTYRYNKNDDKILEDDIIEVKGVIYGAYTYETVLGSTMTLPRIDANEISVVTDYSVIPAESDE